METIRGKTSLDLDLTELNERLANYNRVMLDLGTGDGRYVHSLAKRYPKRFIIGVDSCRENLREYSRTKLPNALFVIANAQGLPRELHGLVSHISMNFPWGSLLEGLLTHDSKLMCGLEAVSSSTTSMDLHLNGGALQEAGWSLEGGSQQIRNNLLQAGWRVEAPTKMSINSLRAFPSTWARRIAVGRDPQALSISGWMIRSERIMRKVAAI
jgi:hypothetical protein